MASKHFIWLIIFAFAACDVQPTAEGQGETLSKWSRLLPQAVDSLIPTSPDAELTESYQELQLEGVLVQLHYHRSHGRLSEVVAEIHPRLRSETNPLFNELSAFFDNAFGRSKGDELFAHWRLETDGKPLDVVLIAEDFDGENPYLAVTYYIGGL